MTERYENFEEANGDIGRVMDEIQALDSIINVELVDTDHNRKAGGEVAWSNIDLRLSLTRTEDDSE